MSNNYPLFYHIGMPKTGTTTVQQVFRSDSRINVIGNRYFNLFEYWKAPFSAYKEGKINIVSEENLVLQMNGFGKLNLLLSRIKRCAPQAHIIVTIREQRALMESRYKYQFPWYGGYSKDFSEWIESSQGMDYLSICMYASIYKSMLAFFPKEQIHFLLFENLKNDYDLFFKDFYSIIGLDFKDLPRIYENKSLSESELSVLKRLNRFKMLRSGTVLSKYELSAFIKIAKIFKRKDTRQSEFRWDNLKFRERIEHDFTSENTELIDLGLFTREDLKRYNYLLE
jgi:hypothetical protein